MPPKYRNHSNQYGFRQDVSIFTSRIDLRNVLNEKDNKHTQWNTLNEEIDEE